MKTRFGAYEDVYPGRLYQLYWFILTNLGEGYMIGSSLITAPVWTCSSGTSYITERICEPASLLIAPTNWDKPKSCDNGCFVFQDNPNLRQVNTRVDIILRFMHAIYIYIYILTLKIIKIRTWCGLKTSSNKLVSCRQDILYMLTIKTENKDFRAWV